MKTITLFCSLLILFSCSNTIVKKPKSEAALEEEKSFKKEIIALGKDGYFLVARGYKFNDHLVSTATISEYSHAVILDVTNDNIIEATAEGVHPLALDSFIHKSFKITMVKPSGYSPERAEDALQCCSDKLGKPYDFTGTVGIDRTEKFYCSELVVECYQHLVDSIKLPHVITPGKVLEYGETIYITPDRIIKK
ncbi:MAG: hypothetical protein COX70_06255 [Flavobacteriales bacterium CG_4_10_14_0_2_um_filter_32_8]|nr:MAG: hypothetical protein COX70_06255 [Flavobacteriales bacterium CG_4_10_14_0_2_um_filter_32_8]PJB14218.1 MAG: hypothetical protein CO118_09695 [Flavobacteriales bacterium CG_4_9_14_3_um_filter_32_8]